MKQQIRITAMLSLVIIGLVIWLVTYLSPSTVPVPKGIPQMFLDDFWTEFNTSVYVPVDPGTKVTVLQMDGWHMEIYITNRPSIVYRWVLDGKVQFEYELPDNKCVRFGDKNVKLTVTKDSFKTTTCP